MGEAKYWDIDGVGVSVYGVPGITEDEARGYVAYVKERVPDAETLIVHPDGDKVMLHYETRKAKFERIRRITGYLVGTIDRWNNAKKAEERERVKHG